MSSPADQAHEPLPYVVELELSLGDDLAPVRHERRVVAYSLFEALMQATVEATGHATPDAKCRVTRIEPDLARYIDMALRRAQAATLVKERR